MPKILIVYYSHSGNTKLIAECIQKQTGGVVVELVPSTAYPTSYDAVVAQAKKEIQAGFLPTLENDFPDCNAYDRIAIGSPNWWSTIAPPVSTFLSKCDLAGKTIMPFFTHGGGGGGHMAKDLTALCSDSTVTESLVISGDGGPRADKMVAAWLEKAK